MRFDKAINVFEGEPAGILLAPVEQARADGLGIFEAWYVMAGVATLTADGLLTEIKEQAFFVVMTDQIFSSAGNSS